MVSIRKLGAVGRTYRHLSRYHQILRVLFKYGFNDLVDRLHIDQYLESGLQMINRKPRHQFSRLSRPERLRMVFEELGPTFIKLGQVLSTRPDLISAEFLDELSKLQDDIAPFSTEELQTIFQEELGYSPEEIFQYFDSQPLAAASIGQVHKARLDNGAEVVVKVQRPGIENTIAVDLEILAHIASLMEQYLEEFQEQRPSAVVQEFARTLSREIDFSIELANIQRFARQFAGNPLIHVPYPCPELSTDRILVMEHINGIKSSDLDALREQGYDLDLIAERGANLMMEQIFIHGFFHADPHPGNIFILPDNIVCFVDFGQMGRLTLKDREDFTDLVLSIVTGNEEKVVSGVLRITVHPVEVNRESLAQDLGDLMDLYLHRPLEDLKTGKILEDLLNLVTRHRIAFKPGLYLMMKALSTVEGVGLMLSPKLKLIRLATPFMRNIQWERMHPKRMAEELSRTGQAYAQLLRDLPEELRIILHQFRSGKTSLRLEHRGMATFLDSLNQVANRIAYAIVLAALVIGSSLVVLSGIPPYWHDIPVIGVIGFLVAAVMGFGLLVSILRSGRF